MSRQENRRYVVAVATLAVGALLQACAVTTGSFIPSRSENSNRSMTYKYDVSHMRVLSPATPHSTLTTTHEKGFQDYKYY